MAKLSDKDRAKELGISLAEYYKLVPADDSHLVEKAIADDDYKYDQIGEFDTGDFGGFPRGNPVGKSDEVYNSQNIDLHWTKVPETESEKALFYGYHIHSKDNPYGLHTHMPGGKLGGAHKHGPQNRLGLHTHTVDTTELDSQFLFSAQSPVYIDGPHEHGSNMPDGGHNHNPQNFG